MDPVERKVGNACKDELYSTMGVVHPRDCGNSSPPTRGGEGSHVGGGTAGPSADK